MTPSAAIRGQRSFWKYVSTATARPRIVGADEVQDRARTPAPGYSNRRWVRNVNRPPRKRLNAKA